MILFSFFVFADGICPDCGDSLVIGIVIGVVGVGLLVAGVCLYLYKTKRLSEYYYMIKDSRHTAFNIFL